jgi:hypothetical protein
MRRELPILAVAIFALAVFVGCGAKEEASTEVGGEAEVPAEAPAEPTPPEPSPTPKETNFTSAAEFAEFDIRVSDDLTPDGHYRNPLVEPGLVSEATEVQNGGPSYWSAPVPATYEVTLPPGAKVRRVEVQGTGGDSAFPECVVFVKKTSDDNWERPERLDLDRRDDEPDQKGKTTRHIFSFRETEAAGVLLGFATGSVEFPDRIHVKDIDILGAIKE